MYKKNTLSIIILIFILYCSINTKQNNLNNKEEKIIHNETNKSIERIDCNYFWTVRQVHVCIKNMLKEECDFLFSNRAFIKETDCYCDVHNKPKNMIETSNYIQYDCK